MTDGSSTSRNAEANNASDSDGAFLDVLRELKADGCNLLVVGDAPRRLFTQASASLLGAATDPRYRLLAITDASQQSVVERLPLPEEMPGSYAETTKIINHAAPPRSVAVDDDRFEAPSLGELPERQVVDPQLAGLQAELAEAMATFDDHAGGLASAELRVGVDSLDMLFKQYDDGVVHRCLQVVTGYVSDYSAMGHYVLTEPYETDRVGSLSSKFDAVVELRSVDPAKHGHHAEERWHVADPELTTDWLPI